MPPFDSGIENPQPETEVRDGLQFWSQILERWTHRPTAHIDDRDSYVSNRPKDGLHNAGLLAQGPATKRNRAAPPSSRILWSRKRAPKGRALVGTQPRRSLRISPATANHPRSRPDPFQNKEESKSLGQGG